jgi:hypothetical protein
MIHDGKTTSTTFARQGPWRKNVFHGLEEAKRDLSIDIPNGCFAFSGFLLYIFSSSPRYFHSADEGYTRIFSNLLNGFSHLFLNFAIFFDGELSIIKLKHKFSCSFPFASHQDCCSCSGSAAQFHLDNAIRELEVEEYFITRIWRRICRCREPKTKGDFGHKQVKTFDLSFN